METEPDVVYGRTHDLGRNNGIIERRRRRKNTREERVQRTAKIGWVCACAGGRMRASGMTMAVNMVAFRAVAVGMVTVNEAAVSVEMTGLRQLDRGSRVGLSQRR